MQVRLEKKKIPLKKMDDVAANNDGHNMAGILAIMPLNQETEFDDDTQDTISTGKCELIISFSFFLIFIIDRRMIYICIMHIADDSGNLVDVPVVYSFEEMESEVKQGVNTGKCELTYCSFYN